MSHFVVGNAVANNISDDETETPDMEMNDNNIRPVAVNSAPRRARFQFNV